MCGKRGERVHDREGEPWLTTRAAEIASTACSGLTMAHNQAYVHLIVRVRSLVERVSPLGAGKPGARMITLDP